MMALATVGLIPSCTGIMFITDAFRFGRFEYSHHEMVDDFRIERYLPPTATSISLNKYAQGHQARYRILEPDLQAYVDSLWNQYGAFSVVKREEQTGERHPASLEIFEHDFQGLGWHPLGPTNRYLSPVEADGGGAVYYFAPASGMAYHRAGYW